MPKIFVSYSRDDSDFADRLIQRLEQSGIDSWMDRQNLEGGDVWPAAISKAIGDCDAFLVLLSSNSVASDNVATEVFLAKNHQRRMIPLLLTEKCVIPYQMEYELAGLQAIPFVDNQKFDQALGLLIKALRGKDDSAAAVPLKTGEHAPETPARGNVQLPQHSVPPTDPPNQQSQPYVPFPSPVNWPAQTPPPPQPQLAVPPLYQLICGRWNVVAAFARMYLEIYPNGIVGGQFMTSYGTGNINSYWQIMPNGMLAIQGQMVTGWQVSPFMLNVTFNQVSLQFLSGFGLDGTLLNWFRVG